MLDEIDLGNIDLNFPFTLPFKVPYSKHELSLKEPMAKINNTYSFCSSTRATTHSAITTSKNKYNEYSLKYFGYFNCLFKKLIQEVTCLKYQNLRARVTRLLMDLLDKHVIILYLP